jgi:hypothetical protein
MRDCVIPVSGDQAGKRPAPLIAGHIYLISADRTTAQSRRQPFFLPRHRYVKSVHKGFLESIGGSSSYSNLIILAKPTCQISVKFGSGYGSALHALKAFKLSQTERAHLLYNSHFRL